MTVGDLKEKLKGVPDDRKIVLSSDPEGNRFWGASGVYPDEKWSGEHLIYEEDWEAGFYPDMTEDDIEKVVYISPKHTV